MLREVVIIFRLSSCLMLKLFLPKTNVLALFFIIFPSRSSTTLNRGKHDWDPTACNWWNGKNEVHLKNQLTVRLGRLHFFLLPHSGNSKVGVDDDAHFASSPTRHTQNSLWMEIARGNGTESAKRNQGPL